MRTEIHVIRRRWLRIAVATMALVLFSSAVAEPSNKWRIQVDRFALAAGEVELSFTPVGGTAMNVIVAIPANTRENDAARLILAAIRQKFGSSVYTLEVDDGEDVLIKANGSTPDFDLIVVRNTVEGLILNLDRE